MKKLQFFTSVPPFRVLEGTVTKLLADGLDIMKKRQVEQDPEKLLTAVRSNWPERSLPEVNYTFRNIDEDGDAVVALGSFSTYIYPLDRAVLAQHYPWETLGAFARYCAERHADLYLVWPPVVKGLINFKSRVTRRNIETIMRHLNEAGIPVLGHPADFQYDRRLFADSGYHLVPEGRELHTEKVVHLVREKTDRPVTAAP